MAAGGSGGQQQVAAGGSSRWQRGAAAGGSRWQQVDGLVQVVLSHAGMEALPQLHAAGGCVVGQHGGEQLPQLVVLHGLLVVLLMLL